MLQMPSYHHDFYTSFTAKRNVGSASKTATLMSSPVEQALSDVILAIKEKPTKIELYNIYTTSFSTLNGDDSEGIEELGSQENSNRHRRAALLQMLEYHFQNNLVMKIDGCVSLVCLREHAPQNLKLVTANDADPVADVVKIISNEVNREKLLEYDISSSTMAKAKEGTSSTRLCLVSGFVSSGKVTSKSLSLSQSIQTLINKKFNQTTLGLAVKLHHQFDSRELIDTLHECGYISSYDEVLRFRKSAAKTTAQDTGVYSGFLNPQCMIKAWFDNFDLQVYTPNDCRESHSMAVQFTQTAEGMIVDN